MATPDSGDSDLPKEPGNEVCDIINCIAKKVPSTGFNWELRSLKALKDTVVCLLFKPYS